MSAIDDRLAFPLFRVPRNRTTGHNRLVRPSQTSYAWMSVDYELGSNERMSLDSSSQLLDLGGQDWSAFFLASTSSSSPSALPSSSVQSQHDARQLSASASPLTPAANGENGSSSCSRRSPSSNAANLLALTELRKAAWTRIYSSGISTGDAAISTTRLPTWKQFDTLMIRRHRYIAVDPRDNRTLGWIACFQAYPQWSDLYDDDLQLDDEDGRQGRTAEIQVMVAEAERKRGIGSFLVNSVLTSLKADKSYSTVQASFFVENEAAHRLFERCGFDPVHTRRNAVRMIDGPNKGLYRDLILVEYKLPPIQPPAPQPQQEQQQPHLDHCSTELQPAIDTTIDPNAVFKRPRLR